MDPIEAIECLHAEDTQSVQSGASTPLQQSQTFTGHTTLQISLPLPDLASREVLPISARKCNLQDILLRNG
jgi:hypothetical protein